MAFAGAAGGSTLLTLLGLAGTGITALAQFNQGRQEAELFEFNAAVQRQQAESIRRSGELEAERQRRQARSFSAAQTASFAAAGIRPNVGSPLDVIINDAAELELDAKIIEYNTRLDVLNALVGADTSLLRAQQARSSAFITAGATLLSGIPSLSKLGRTGTLTKPKGNLPKGSFTVPGSFTA